MHSVNRTALLALSISITALLPMAAQADSSDRRTMPTEQREDQGKPLDDDRILTATLR